MLENLNRGPQQGVSPRIPGAGAPFIGCDAGSANGHIFAAITFLGTGSQSGGMNQPEWNEPQGNR